MQPEATDPTPTDGESQGRFVGGKRRPATVFAAGGDYREPARNDLDGQLMAAPPSMATATFCSPPSHVSIELAGDGQIGE